MLRSPLLVLAIAIVALLALIPAGKAEAEWPEKGTIIFLELELKTDNGLQAHLEATPDDVVTLEFRDKGHFVSYEVQGEVTETGLKVRFGRLGLIDVVFTPTVTLNSTEPSAGCTGAPRTLKEGVFTGMISFTGEREYVRVEGSEATGSMSVLPEWRCLDEPPPIGATFRPYGSIRRTAGASRLLARDSEDESEHASLHADSRRCGCFFSAGIHHRNRKGRRGRSIFYGAKAERREGMAITRVTQAFAGPSAFVFDHNAGTATLRAPRPLSGRATFRERPGRDLWRSTIRVPLLGADPLRTGGPEFRVGLYPEYHFD
ncbi:MAG TPA: hypothetical protein VD761_06005 [Solirubrobacterales bacterium]|nr:hypothetical protein [Solirubrobacterales bacterium]